jgi:DNA-directed RNA polymerase subunit alpha
MRIEGVLHEFSSLAGVREDVTDIVLNVKQIALRMEGDQPRRLQLSATGPGEVTAGQIATTGDIEVMNSSLVICHLDDGATLNMELTAESGKGYVPAAANRPVDAPIGLIPVDALYSPVRQVSYKVENTRVGQELDYDKLTLTMRSPMPPASFRTSSSCSSISTTAWQSATRALRPAAAFPRLRTRRRTPTSSIVTS